jgi:hypothetical protein
MLTREQRIRWGLTPDPPPPYEPIALDVIERTIARESRKISAISLALVLVLGTPLYLLSPTAAVVFILNCGPGIGRAVSRWWIRKLP